MPRTCPSGLLTVLNSQTPTLATIIKVTRQDGKVFGFTSCDRDLTISGVLYERQSAISPSVIQNTVGTGVDNTDFMGLLDSNKITTTDILAGIWDNAVMELSICDYTGSTVGVMTIITGTMGEVSFQDGQYTAEFRSLAQRLQQEMADLIQATCRVASFGDSQCAAGGLIGTHPLSFFQRPGLTVASVITQGSVFTVQTSDTTGFFDYGVILFTSGLNAGISREIKSSPAGGGGLATITVQESFPFAIAVNDVLTLTAGCDRNYTTCVNKFQNQQNFRGEPFLPGVDQLLKRGTTT